MRKVVVLFPHPEYVKAALEPNFTEAVIGKEKFEKNIRIVSKLLNEYRRRGYKIVFITFDDKKVDKLFRKKRNDAVINAGVSFEEMLSGKYPDFKELAAKVGNVRRVIVGGFHFTDCVRKFAEEMAKIAPTKVDLFMTDAGFLHGSVYRIGYRIGLDKKRLEKMLKMAGLKRYQSGL